MQSDESQTQQWGCVNLCGTKKRLQSPGELVWEVLWVCPHVNKVGKDIFFTGNVICRATKA